jgi:hypothetical protein
MGAPDEAAIRPLIELRDAAPDALQLVSLATAPLPPPLLPVTARSADPNAEADTAFRWYARRRGLIGTAEV